MCEWAAEAWMAELLSRTWAQAHTLSYVQLFSHGDNERDLVRGASRRKRLVRHAARN